MERINQALASGTPEVTVMNGDSVTLATGSLTISDNQVDATTGTIKLKAEFGNEDNALWPGLAVTTSLRLGVDKDVLVVPAHAIQRGANGPFVYVVDDQTRAAVRPVKVSRQNVATAAISEGLTEGERVVTTGAFLLRPGVQVAIDERSGS